MDSLGDAFREACDALAHRLAGDKSACNTCIIGFHLTGDCIMVCLGVRVCWMRAKGNCVEGVWMCQRVVDTGDCWEQRCVLLRTLRRESDVGGLESGSAGKR